MWASSFADLAKKASELQEQASAVAASSMPTASLFNLDGLQGQDEQHVSSSRKATSDSNNPYTVESFLSTPQPAKPKLSMSSPIVPRSTIIPPLPPQKPKAASGSSALKLVVPTTATKTYSSKGEGSPTLQLQKQPLGQDVSHFTTAAAFTTLGVGSDNTPPSTTLTVDAKDTPPPPISTPTTTAEAPTIQSPMESVLPEPATTTALEPENQNVVSSSNVDDEQSAPQPDLLVESSTSSCLNQVVTDSDNGFFSTTPPTEMEQRAPEEEDTDKEQEPLVSTQLEIGSAATELSHIGCVVAENETVTNPETSVSLSASLPQTNEVIDSNSHNQETEEATAAVAVVPAVPDDHVLELFSQQLQRLEENHRVEFSKLEKDHDQVLQQLQQELEWHRTEHGLQGKQLDMLKENFTLQLNRLQTDLEEKSQLLQARDKERKKMEEQQLKELRAMEKNVNLAEEEARSSRLTVEELKKALMESNNEVNSSSDSYETLKGRVKVVAGELKERRVECRELQVRVEELTLSKTELQDRVLRLQDQGATLDHAKSATLLEVDALKDKLELAETAVEESKSAIHKEKLKGEEVLATYKKKAQTALAVANARASSAIQSKEEAELEARAARSVADSTMERARLAETKGNEAMAQAKAFVESVEAQAPEIARLKGELASVTQERLELKSLVEKLQLNADKVMCEVTTLASQLESEKSNSLQFQSELVDALNRANALEEAVNKLGREKMRLLDELQSQERVTQGQQPSTTNGGPSTATPPHEAFVSKQSMIEQSHAESTIRMLQQELQDANAAIKELKETLRNSMGDSEQAAVDDQPGRDSNAAGQNGANSMPLFYAMEKQAELTQARNEISRLASLLGDAESTKQEALDAMDEMKRKMEEAESRLQRQKRLGGGHNNSVPAAKVGGGDSKTTVAKGGKTEDQDGENGNVNLEYLKNIVLSYLNAKSVAERKALLPVISTVLCFTADEQQRALHETANAGGGSHLLDAVTDSMLKFRW